MPSDGVEKSSNLSVDQRIQQIMEQLMAYARLDFDQRIELDELDDELTAISAGVNMLGEELREQTISLKEKERLLKELHHRVKNNMQIIISLMRLQTMNEKDERILGFVRDSKSRIDSMVLVHEMLYSSESFEFTQLEDYADFLQRSIFMSYAPPGHQIETKINISKACRFKIDRMIPIGLIINEFFSNSLKHAFPDNQGQVLLNGDQKNEGFNIVYEDDGVGFPDDFDPYDTETLGMQLIIMLTEQLDGELTIEQPKILKSDRAGVRFSITF